MTTMFYDVHQETDKYLKEQRVPGADFDEVMYADDTICISTDTRTINQFVREIEETGIKYGLKLNRNKCEVLTTEKNPNIHFNQGEKIKITDTVKYVGISLNKEGNSKKEIGARIANAMITLQKLQIFWRHSNCPTAYKLIALDAIVRSKLLYGTESLHLGEPEIKRLEKIHLQALRKILRWDTTYINRENTNKKIYEEVNENIAKTMKEINKVRREQKKPKKKIKKVITFTERTRIFQG